MPYNLDDRVKVDFFGDGNERTGEIDAIDFEGDPSHPYRVWYDEPWIDEDNEPIECEWVSEHQMTLVQPL
jgi:hypothetical protein